MEWTTQQHCNSLSVNTLKNFLDNFCNDSLYNMDDHLHTCN